MKVTIHMEKIGYIKEKFEKASEDDILKLINEYSGDERSGVKAVISKYLKKLDALKNERERLYLMTEFERKYADFSLICGIDEVGRGPLAGPVMAGAVILPKDCEILYINDSKKLSAKKREELYDEIKEKAIASATAIKDHNRIDEINILNATYEAMRDAIKKLDPSPDMILADAVHIPDITIKQAGIVKGDAKSISIAAASIIAKVERDALMEEYDRLYPGYGFANNKGYGSKEHIDALKNLGPCPIHRRTYIGNFI